MRINTDLNILIKEETSGEYSITVNNKHYPNERLRYDNRTNLWSVANDPGFQAYDNWIEAALRLPRTSLLLLTGV